MKMDKITNKPLTMIVNETKMKLVNICNESGLPPIILDLIVQGVYSDIHYIVEKQAADEEAAYLKSLEENKIQNSKGDDNEQKTK